MPEELTEHEEELRDDRHVVRSVFRRILAFVVAGLAVLLLFIGGVLHTADGMVGSPSSFANTVVSTLNAKGVEQSLASSALTEITSSLPTSDQARMQSSRPALEQALVATMKNPSTQALVKAELEQAYQAATQATSSKQNFSVQPLLVAFASSLHSVDPQIPATPPATKTSTSVAITPVKGLSSVASDLGATSWAVLLVGLGLLLVAGLALVRGLTLQLCTVGLGLALPAALFVGGANAATSSTASMHLGSASLRIVVQSLLQHVSGALIGTALLYVVLAVVIGGAWIGLFEVKRRKHSAA